MKMFRLLTAVYFIGNLQCAFAISPKFQEVKIGLWIEGVGQESSEPIILGEQSTSHSFKVSRALPEELSVVLEDKF